MNECKCGCGSLVKGTWKRGHSARGRTLAGRFWEKVEKGPGCWEWTAATYPDGYGNFVVEPGKNRGAHRVSYELNIGPIPDGLEVCHSCDNPGCVNPDHLFAATHRENMHDMFRKGRNGNVALDREQERQVRSLLAEGWDRQWVADAFGISIPTTYYLKKRKFEGRAVTA
jgi:hypothetical protein